MYTYIYTHTYTYIHIHKYIHTHTHIRVCIYIYIRMYVESSVQQLECTTWCCNVLQCVRNTLRKRARAHDSDRARGLCSTAIVRAHHVHDITLYLALT